MEPLSAPVALRADDVPATWLLGATEPDESPTATVHGPAASLALLLWHRIGLDHPSLRVDGDTAAWADALARPLTP